MSPPLRGKNFSQDQIKTLLLLEISKQILFTCDLPEEHYISIVFLEEIETRTLYGYNYAFKRSFNAKLFFNQFYFWETVPRYVIIFLGLLYF